MTSDSASAGSSRSKAPARTWATTARPFGSPSGRQRRAAARAARGRRARSPPRRSAWPGARRDPAAAARGRRAAGERALDRGRPARAAVEHEPRPVLGDDRERHPLVVGLRVGDDEQVEPLRRRRRRAGAGSGRRAGRCRRGRDVPSRWSSVASPWPTSRNVTASSPGASRSGSARGQRTKRERGDRAPARRPAPATGGRRARSRRAARSARPARGGERAVARRAGRPRRRQPHRHRGERRAPRRRRRPTPGSRAAARRAG